MKAQVCFVSQRAFPGDSRLETEVESLQQAGCAVTMVCMRGKRQPLHSVEGGVSIYRIPSMERRRAGKVRYVVEYFSFFLPALLLLAVMQVVKGFRLVHVTNLPDVLLFSALVPKVLGAKIIFDVRECTPEMFTDRFGAQPGSRIIRIMTAIEQASLKFADANITCTEQMRQALISRGGQPEKISVVLNSAASHLQLDPILPDPTDEAKDEFRIVTHGTVIRRYGHALLIEAMAEVIREIPQARLTIFGKGELLPELAAQIKTLGLQNCVRLAGFVPDDELLAQLRRAHCGVAPLLKNPESDLVHTYKMYEYLHLGIPLVISRTTAVAAYFDDQSLRFFEPNDAHSLAEALIDLAHDPAKRYALASHALKVYEQYSPTRQRAAYARLVAGLLQTPETPASADALEMGHEN